MAEGICSVSDCGRKVRLRELCTTHYKRWLETGVVGGPIARRMSNRGKSCASPACDRPAASRGFCQRHYQRSVSGGEIDTPIAPQHQRKAVVTYRGVHARLERDFGPASQYGCVDCGDPAHDWSYDNDDPEELSQFLAGRWWIYSLDQSHYAPRCKPCHIRLDRSTGVAVFDVSVRRDKSRCAHGHPVTPENSYVRSNGHRVCRVCRREDAARRRRARQIDRLLGDWEQAPA